MVAGVNTIEKVNYNLASNMLASFLGPSRNPEMYPFHFLLLFLVVKCYKFKCLNISIKTGGGTMLKILWFRITILTLNSPITIHDFLHILQNEEDEEDEDRSDGSSSSSEDSSESDTD